LGLWRQGAEEGVEGEGQEEGEESVGDEDAGEEEDAGGGEDEEAGVEGGVLPSRERPRMARARGKWTAKVIARSWWRMEFASHSSAEARMNGAPELLGVEVEGAKSLRLAAVIQ